MPATRAGSLGPGLYGNTTGGALPLALNAVAGSLKQVA
jgi:hypothetical protein